VSLPDFYRFERTAVDFSLRGGSTNSYFIRDRDMNLVAYCLVKGMCITHPTVFQETPEASTPWFHMVAERKILNRAYFLFEPEWTSPFATVTSRGKGHWRILDDAERQVGVFVDQSSTGEKVAEAVLGGSPDTYAVVYGERVLAHIRMQPRPETELPSREPGFLKRVFKKFMQPSDWVMVLEPGSAGMDHRPLLAGMILLIEHTISMAKSN
jgi:hypothetical protein